MKKLCAIAMVTVLPVCSLAADSNPSVNNYDDPVSLTEVNMAGPRLGISGVVDNGAFAQELTKRNVSHVFSQFGWHFEYKVRPEGVPDAPAFVIEIVPMIGGLEYGVFIPSLTLPMGIRFANGFEFGLGPNVAVGGPTPTTAVVLAGGYCFNYRGIGIPLTWSVAKGSGGYTTSFLFGYAIIKSKKHRETVVVN